MKTELVFVAVCSQCSVQYFKIVFIIKKCTDKSTPYRKGKHCCLKG